MHPAITIAVKAARRAGSIINRASTDIDMIKVSSKRQNDFVTEVDKAAEAAIIDVLREAYPDHAILAEESGASAGRGDSEFQWIIDPLDGTTNFIHGFPQFAVSIALAHKGQIQQAVVFDPSRNELFRQQGPRRLPQRKTHPRLEAHQARGIADRHRIPVPRVGPR